MLATTISQTGKKFCLLRIFHLCKFRASFPVLPIWQDPRSLNADPPPVLQILLQPPFPNLTTSPRCPENLHKVSKLRPKSSGHALLRKWHQAAFPSHACDAHSHHIYLKTFSHSHHLHLAAQVTILFKVWTLLLPQSGSPTSTLVVGEPDYPSPPINNHIVLQIACRANWASFAKTLIILQKHRTLCTHFTLCKNIAHFAKHCIFCTQHTTLTCAHFANTFLICCWRATLPRLICLLAIYKIFKGFNIHTQKAYIIALILQALL